MKFIVLLAAIALGWFLIARPHSAEKKSPIAAAPASTSAPALAAPRPAATPTALRRPIARTQEVLGEVKQRNGTGEF